jgi:hypothetical protein
MHYVQSDELERAALEEKVGGLMRMAQKQDAYTRQMEKELLDSTVSERKWRKEHSAQTQQKARLMEMNTRLRKELQDTQNQLHKFEKQLSKYECVPTSGSENSDYEDTEVKRSRTPSLEQLRRAQEKQKHRGSRQSIHGSRQSLQGSRQSLQGSRQSLLGSKQNLLGSKQNLDEAAGSSDNVEELKQKSPGKKKPKKRKKSGSESEPDEPSLQVPQMAVQGGDVSTASHCIAH